MKITYRLNGREISPEELRQCRRQFKIRYIGSHLHIVRNIQLFYIKILASDVEIIL